MARLESSLRPVAKDEEGKEGGLMLVAVKSGSPNRTPSKFKLFFPPRFQQTDPRIVRIERVLG